ncbi:nuclear transport factor 2 family protein [Actinoplanes sp. TBRC 11911]|uniref:nuclear transport factor 2 family protein n=1 Tax=Actinoplanes sp. TBRC 11911 TaxID=2729386 RepID=UPI00145D4AB3|nr:nuclear transport factor 2 family protein [Actinoplanes sp. TBRC 11911]NMO55402.1 nuclear transport factor 2 family protein [Actinoplanes sp. TBRC 11911]
MVNARVQSDDTRERAEEFLHLLGGDDVDRIKDLFAESIDWYVPGDTDLPWTGPRTRGSDVPAFFKTMNSAFRPGQSEYAVDHIIVEDDDAVVVAKATHTFTRSGKRFTTPLIMLLRVKDSKIVRLHLYEDTYLVSRSFSI